jgi:hypothetical protein
MPKLSGAPDVGDLVTPYEGSFNEFFWKMGEARLVIATRGIEVQVLDSRGTALLWTWVARARVEVVNADR